MFKEVQTINRLKLENFLRANNKGRYFGITFIKRNGEKRVMNARLGIKPKGSGRKTVGRLEDPYMVVWSTNDQGYRAVNLRTVRRVTADGNLYLVY